MVKMHLLIQPPVQLGHVPALMDFILKAHCITATFFQSFLHHITNHDFACVQDGEGVGDVDGEREMESTERKKEWKREKDWKYVCPGDGFTVYVDMKEHFT